MNDRRYGKRAKRSSPLGSALLVLLVVLLLGGGVFAAKKMGLLSQKKTRQAETSAVETLAEGEEDASVSHAPAASLIAPLFDDEEEEKPSEEKAVQTAQETVTAPVEPTLPGEGITVCIDPGHGGKDPGCNTPNRLEKDDVLRLGLAMRTAMEAQGITVLMTREDDTFIPLDERCHMANKAKADYYISVHRNIFDNSDVYGNEIWKSFSASEEAAALADNLMDALEGVGIQKNRGVREGSQDGHGDYYVLNNTKMPSALLEMGFMQNRKDNKYFDKHVDEYAEAMTQAVLDTWEEFHVDLDDVANIDKS